LEAIAKLYGHINHSNKNRIFDKTTTPYNYLEKDLSTEPQKTQSTSTAITRTSTQSSTTNSVLIESDSLSKTEFGHLCHDGKFDAISVLSDNFTYIFKDSFVYRIGK